jgi:hypothetical protein
MSVTTLAGVTDSVGSSGSSNGIGTNSKFNRPNGIDISPDRTYALVGDDSNHLLRMIDLGTASVTTLAGGGVAGSSGSTNGLGTNAKLNHPSLCFSFSPDGSYALICDGNNYLIRSLDLSTMTLTTNPCWCLFRQLTAEIDESGEISSGDEMSQFEINTSSNSESENDNESDRSTSKSEKVKNALAALPLFRSSDHEERFESFSSISGDDDGEEEEDDDTSEERGAIRVVMDCGAERREAKRIGE